MSIYRPLSLSQNEIRILVINDTDDFEAPLQCQLEYSALGARRPYKALSYCWGDPTQQERIFVSGAHVWVTASLAEALRVLRQRGVRRIWADAICINQSDLEERSQQVLKMNAIYRSADTVIAWLGYSGPMHHAETARVGERAAWMSRSLAQYTSVRKREIDPRRASRWPFSYLNGLPEHNWAAFKALLENRYWTRAWIIQEFAMAVRLEILWNGRVFPEATLAAAVKVCARFRSVVKAAQVVSESSCRHIRQLCKFRESQRDFTPIRLLRALQMSHRAQSTDPRDKVFAILALTYDGPTVLPTPSYILSQEELNLEATLTLIRLTNSLDYVLLRRSPPTSWVVEWFNGNTWSSKRIVSYLLGQSRCLLARTGYLGSTVSPTWRASDDTKPYFEKSETGLFVRGNIVGAIERCTTTAYPEDTAAPRPPRPPPDQPAETMLRARPRLGAVYATNALYFCLGMVMEPDPKAWDDPKRGRDFYKQLGTLIHNHKELSLTRQDRRFLQWLKQSKNAALRLNQSDTLRSLLGQVQPRFWSGRIKDNRDWVKIAWNTLRLGFRLCVMNTGHIGWVTRHARLGDKIAVIHGCSVPAVLRAVEGSSAYQIVGHGIIYNLMEGEGLRVADGMEILLQ
ncbi:hypothetical protein NKR23_g269 [Pleurostoma richardsiae]|uniref:Heterokaryon incompatibility domain-containing protein n=1 Tax=Pleurostoma richardsiae TaxID=41990 RepID=A0AA38VYG4_9PEZI|nr:hypothetical protein NKR23_g269 [Pleurostoma richardsiae]